MGFSDEWADVDSKKMYQKIPGGPPGDSARGPLASRKER